MTCIIVAKVVILLTEINDKIFRLLAADVESKKMCPLPVPEP